MKVWHLMTMYVVGLLLSAGISIGFVLFCVWLGAKIVKAVW